MAPKTELKNQIVLFYLGSFLSSVGSMTYLVSSMAFMAKMGVSISQIGLFVGCTRFFPLVVSVFYGDLADRVSARKLIVISELMAACASVGLVLAWQPAGQSIFYFTLFSILRGVFLIVQGPGKSRIAKEIAGSDFASNSRTAIWLNKVTHGSALFAAGLGWIAVKFLSIYYVLAFDLLTFFINGIFVWQLSLGDVGVAQADEMRPNILRKFKDLYHFNPKVAVYDLVLAVIMCGANVFSARIAGPHDELIPLFLASYGLAVWTSGYLERSRFVSSLHLSVWVILGFGYITLGILANTGFGALGVYFICDSAYWTLFHRYSGQIQTQSPLERTASVFSARMIQMLIVLSIGEFVVGAWAEKLPVFWDAAWRGVACLLMAGTLGFIALRSREKDVSSN